MPNSNFYVSTRIWPAVLRQATYGTIKFGTYYTLKTIATERELLIDHDGNERVWANVLCAVTAGAVSSAIATPTDVLKVRMQVHGKGTENHGLFGCFLQIYRLEGVRGLWRVSHGREFLSSSVFKVLFCYTGSWTNCSASGSHCGSWAARLWLLQIAFNGDLWRSGFKSFYVSPLDWSKATNSFNLNVFFFVWL